MPLGEIINFRSEFEAAFPATEKETGGGLFSQKFYLEVQLYFKEATTAEIKDAANLSSRISSADLKKFQVVNTRKFLLRNAQKNGFFQFYPVSFDQAYVSACSVYIHSIVKGKKNLNVCITTFSFARIQIQRCISVQRINADSEQGWAANAEGKANYLGRTENSG